MCKQNVKVNNNGLDPYFRIAMASFLIRKAENGITAIFAAVWQRT
jgi:hypothetical protein